MEHKPSSTRDYFIALFIAVILFVLLGSYLYVRRGYMFDAPLSAGALYVPNKVVAGTAVVMLSLTFLVGSVARYFDRFDAWLGYRKEIGIVGGFLALAHGIISYFFVPKKFSAESFWQGDSLFTTLAGLLAALILAALIVISLKVMIEKIGGSRWWFLQRWGIRLVVMFTLFHVIAMKWAGWERWYTRGVSQTPELLNPWMTPASILVVLFMVWIVSIRIFETLFVYKNLGFQTKEITMDPVLKRRGKNFFVVSFWLFVLAYILVITRWMGV